MNKTDDDFNTLAGAEGASHEELTLRGSRRLADCDPEISALLDREIRYEAEVLPMIASASLADTAVLSAQGAAIGNVTAEGYPGARYHTGTAQFDEVERLAIERAKAAFGAQYANVQPHSCSSANLTVLFTLLAPGDTILGLGLPAGGHLTHGARASVTGRYFNAVHYGLDGEGLIDYEELARLAELHRPKLIVAGASAYPRTIDYQRFRAVADSVGAWLLADMSHVAGLVAAGVHPSPVDAAHVTTTSTYKQLGGPRGGLILLGADCDTTGPDGRTTLATLMQRGVFPRTQGTPSPASIAAKATAFRLVGEPAFTAWARLVVADARALAAALARRGHRILTGGTDTHLILIDAGTRGITGAIAESALLECGILVNRNQIAGDTLPPSISSGVRLGTNILAQRGFTPEDMEQCAELFDAALTAVLPKGDVEYVLDDSVRERVRAGVGELAARRPAPRNLL
jgi:glycine hydroxymethyltransferase